MGWLLALDGATDELSLALVSPQGQVHPRAQAGGAQASAQLLPAIQSLMLDLRVQPVDVDALAYGQGPGAFTSLRAICACVQGLAWGWGKPVLALDSLLLPAEAVASELDEGKGGAFDVAVAMDARMGELYAARYRREGGAWSALTAPGLWAPGALREAWLGDAAPQHWLGSGLPMLGMAASRPAQFTARAQALGRLAWQAWRRGEVMDAAQAQPLYVRDKVAQTSAERAALAAGAHAEAEPARGLLA